MDGYEKGESFFFPPVTTWKQIRTSGVLLRVNVSFDKRYCCLFISSFV